MCTHGTLLVCDVQVGVGPCLILTITFASCNSSRIERDNCCQRERSGGKDIPPIRNRMHQVKLHQTGCMANRVKWIRCKLQVIVNFSARFGEKNDVWTWSKHSMINCIWKHCMQSTSEKNAFYMEKHSENEHHDYKNNKRLRIHITCRHTRPCSSPGKPPRRSQHVGSELRESFVPWYFPVRSHSSRSHLLYMQLFYLATLLFATLVIYFTWTKVRILPGFPSRYFFRPYCYYFAILYIPIYLSGWCIYVWLSDGY